MIYLIGFALTYGLVWLCARRTPALADRFVCRKQAGGLIIRKSRLQQRFAFLLAALPLFLISALREGIGTDYYFTYTPRFLEILDGERTYYEIGFYWFNRLVGAFTSNPQWIFVTTSAVFIGFVFLAFYENAEDLPFCIVTLLITGEYFVSLNNLRQAMAAAILLCGYRFLRQKQWISFALLALFCSTLHQSMLIFLAVLVLVIALDYIPLERLLVLLTIGVALLLVLCHSSTTLLRLFLPERLVYYIEYAIFTQPTIGMLRTLVNIALLAFLLFTRRRANTCALDILIIIQFLAVAICLFDSILPATYRILRLFTFWQLLSLPLAVEQYSNRLGDRRIIQWGLIAVLGFLCVYSLVFLGTEEILPYRSIFH